jgi:hypothetical protein
MIELIKLGSLLIASSMVIASLIALVACWVNCQYCGQPRTQDECEGCNLRWRKILFQIRRVG